MGQSLTSDAAATLIQSTELGVLRGRKLEKKGKLFFSTSDSTVGRQISGIGAGESRTKDLMVFCFLMTFDGGADVAELASRPLKFVLLSHGVELLLRSDCQPLTTSCHLESREAMQLVLTRVKYGRNEACHFGVKVAMCLLCFCHELSFPLMVTSGPRCCDGGGEMLREKIPNQQHPLWTWHEQKFLKIK